jgi:predicted HAD superfamily Cof-like phosphohydrolase
MTTSKTRYQMVEEFHKKNGFPVGVPLERAPESLYVSGALSARSVQVLELFSGTGNQAYLRSHLQLEELGEEHEALAKGDKLKLLDALADLLYVVEGTAVCYGLPIDAAFLEVHLSNMTKERVPDDAHSSRLRKKGPHWVPPDLESVLAGRPTVLQGLNLLAMLEKCTVLELLKRERVLNAARIDGYFADMIGRGISGQDISALKSKVKELLLGDAYAPGRAQEAR